MAGESPDRSEQKQSSGETAGSERDPRLAVFRDAPTDTETSAEPDSVAADTERGGAEPAAPETSTPKTDTAKPAASEPAASKTAAPKADDAASDDAASDDAAPDGKKAGGGKAAGGKAGGGKAGDAKAGDAKAGGKKVGSAKRDADVTGSGEPDAENAAEGKSDAEKSAPEEADAEQGAPEKGDDRLKAAVAAWVAGKGAPEGAAGAEEAETRDGASGDASDGSSGAAKAPAGDAAEGGDDAGPGLPVREPGAKGKQGAGQVDQPTAVFGTLAPKSTSGSTPVDEATRVFAAVNPKGAKKGTKKDTDAGAEAGADATKGPEGSKGPEASEGAADNADSAKRAKGGKGAKDAKDATKEAEARKATAAAIPKRSEAAKKAAAGTPDADKDAAEGAKKAEAEAEGKKADAELDSKPTPSPEKSTASPEKTADDKKAAEADKKPTTAKGGEDGKDGEDGQADKGTKQGAKQDGKQDAKKALERDSERTSQFVALKSADERPAKPPKPVGKPAGEPLGKPGTAAGTGKDAADAAKAPSDTTKAPADAAKTPSDAPKTAADAAKAAPGDPAATAALPAAVPPAGPQPTAAESSTAAPGAGPGALPESERTKQQPLPPLDLLAQLTNTPPPPETPIRTIVRRFKIWTPLALLLLLVFVIVQAVRPLPDPGLTLTSDATYSFDGSKPSMPWPSEGQAYVDVSGLGPIGSYGEQKPVPIGSVAKTMTAYIIMRDHPLKPGKPGKKIRIDKQAEEDGKKGAGHGDESVLDTVKEGDTISQKDALSAVMIPSANNIARLLARWDAGSQEAFVKKMNATAKELGMKNTTYTDPSGLIETTVSTAEDQVKLGKKAMEMPALVDITKLPSWTDPSGKQWRNYNTLPPYNNAIGLKTGSTSKAGGNLLFAGLQRVGGTTQLIVGAVLGQHRTPIIDTANAVSKDLLTTTQGALEDRTVLKKGDVVGVVDDGLGGTTPVVLTKDVKAVGWSGLTVKLGLSGNGKTIPHEAKAGTKVGVLTAGSGPGQVKVPVELQKDLAEPSFGAKLTRVS
ncbi:D-alanyl-D-alanine carboxypeptidase family protein [Streptomyces niger]|uniref:D-alanyl-D-alanine carboxypeptidase family protein n=1 Tax=Streptomyces niger TaxID=66373 RepID=UPI00069A6375|nr:D-alanyl-D-alanine carboxypeptidase [Streptomyces niger]